MAKQNNYKPAQLPVYQEPKAEPAAVASPVVDSVKRCASCRFYDGEHRCRRYPPKVIVPSGGIWPAVAPDDWCGEHQSKLVG